MRVDYVTGADLMVARSVLDECGAFHPAFFMYCEETEMEHRYMKHGFRRVIIQGSEIVHLEGKSNKPHSPKRVSMVLKSQFLYFKKTNSYFIYFLYSPIFKFAYVLTYILCFPFIHGNTRQKIEHLGDVISM